MTGKKIVYETFLYEMLHSQKIHGSKNIIGFPNSLFVNFRNRNTHKNTEKIDKFRPKNKIHVQVFTEMIKILTHTGRLEYYPNKIILLACH